MDNDALAAILAKRTPGEMGEIIGNTVHIYCDDGHWHWFLSGPPENIAAALAAVNACGPLLERVRELEAKIDKLERPWITES